MKTKLTMKDTLEFLKKYPLKNLAIINLVEIHPQSVSTIDRIGDTLIARTGGEWGWVLISSRNQDELQRASAILNDDDIRFACLEDWMLPIVRGKRDVEIITEGYRYIFPDDMKLEEPAREVVPLKKSDAIILNEKWDYRDPGTLGYIERQIETDISGGIVEDGKLVAWSMMHDIGAIGIAYVLEEYRGRGFARDVTLHMIKSLRARGRLPHAYIAIENRMPQEIVENRGVVKGDRYSWLKLKRG